MQVSKAVQGSDEWLNERIGKATASRFADIIAKTRSGYSTSRANYRSELVIERLTNQRTDGFKSSAMEWGNEYEPVARMRYELHTGNQVEETGLWHTDGYGASPDGLVGEDGLIEIKCPNTSTHLETLKTRKAPKKYYAQMQGQMWLTGRKWCDFVSFDPRLPENAQLFVARVERDEEFIKELEQEVKQFLQEVEAEQEFVAGFELIERNNISIK